MVLIYGDPPTIPTGLSQLDRLLQRAVKFNKFGYLIQAQSIANMITETSSTSDRRLRNKIVKDPTGPLQTHVHRHNTHFSFLFIYLFLFFSIVILITP